MPSTMERYAIDFDKDESFMTVDGFLKFDELIEKKLKSISETKNKLDSINNEEIETLQKKLLFFENQNEFLE